MLVSLFSCYQKTPKKCKDKQECAQWFASPQTIRNILEACLSRVSTLKGQALIVQHLTMYDGVVEKVLIDLMNDLQSDCYVAGFSETQNANIFQFALTGVKDKLIEDLRYWYCYFNFF